MKTEALSNINYGLYVLTANELGKDNGCIINTVMQVTSSPCQLEVVVNKANYTCGMIQRTKKFNISVLNENSKFKIFKHFGYQSGKSYNKFADFIDVKRTDNGVLYITRDTNSYFSVYVKQEIDLGSHILFIGEVVDSDVLNAVPTVTYNYYQKNIKPAETLTSSKGWKCKICGYVYENKRIPEDYICPICKHGVIDFEKI